MTIKEAFEYLSSECGIGMKNPFIALRNLVEAFGKVADEMDPTPSGDFVKKSGDTMTGKLTVEDDIECTSDIYSGWVYSTAYSFKGTPLGGQVDLVSRATLGDTVQIEVPQKNGTMALTKDIAVYSTDEKLVGTWIDGSRVYQKSFTLPNAISINNVDWTNTGVTISNINKVIYGEMNRNGDHYFACSFRANDSEIQLQTYYDGAQCNTDSIITIRYTKVTT